MMESGKVFIEIIEVVGERAHSCWGAYQKFTITVCGADET